MTHRTRRVVPRTLSLFALAAPLAACGGCGPGGGAVGTGLHVEDDSARACEVLLKMTGPEVPAVEFAAEVAGESIPKAPHLSLAFTARKDASLEGVELAKLKFTGEAKPAELVKATCYDPSGKPLAGQPLKLE